MSGDVAGKMVEGASLRSVEHSEPASRVFARPDDAEIAAAVRIGRRERHDRGRSVVVETGFRAGRTLQRALPIVAFGSETTSSVSLSHGGGCPIHPSRQSGA